MKKFKYCLLIVIITYFIYSSLTFSSGKHFVVPKISSEQSIIFDSNQSTDLDGLQQRFYAILQNECFGGILSQGLKCFKKLKEIQDDLRTKGDNNSCHQCLYNKQKNKIIINHHVFWQLKSQNECKWRIMLLNINSFLKTQNPCCTKLIFWKLSNFFKVYEKELLEKYESEINTGRFEIKTFDLESLCSNDESSFTNSQICSSSSRISSEYKFDSNLVSLSDLVRFFVSDIYGGIWTDGDVIYLEDMRLLWRKNFAYRWSYTNDYNTAVMGFNKRFNPEINELLNKIANKKGLFSVKQFLNWFHPFSLKNYLKKESIFNSTILNCYHSYLFDPAWLCHDRVEKKNFSNSNCNFKEFFQDSNATNLKRDFYPGSFTYHIHLGNCKQISQNSYFSYFENYFDSY